MDKELLFKSRLQEHEHEIPGVGVVRYRALSREEGLSLSDKEMDLDVAERKVLSMAMIDPKLSEEDVKVWQSVSPAGELQDLTEKIAEISGMTPRYDKKAYQQFRG